MNNKMITVVYYTSNREPEQFERRVQAKLLEVIGDLPLVSASQKPMDFGKNICLGEMEPHGMSLTTQFIAACEAATTPLIAVAEADTIYPPTGYFDYVPEKTDWAYRYTNLWILNRGEPLFHRKCFSNCAMIAGREYMINALKEWQERWLVGKARQKDYWKKRRGWEPFTGELPVVNMKTKYGMSPKTGLSKCMMPLKELPYWGSAVALQQEMLGDIK